MIKHLTDYEDKDEQGISLRDAVINNSLKDIPKIKKDSKKHLQKVLQHF